MKVKNMTKKVDKFRPCSLARTRELAKLARTASDALISGFIWVESREGGPYWNNIEIRLSQIADAFEKAFKDAVLARKIELAAKRSKAAAKKEVAKPVAVWSPDVPVVKTRADAFKARRAKRVA
jgi:hypothetical protein